MKRFRQVLLKGNFSCLLSTKRKLTLIYGYLKSQFFLCEIHLNNMLHSAVI